VTDLERINCPGCQQLIRVPPDVLGQRAQCPFCKCHFRAPVRNDDGSIAEPTLLRRNPFGQSRTILPGYFLILVGLLGIITNAAVVGRAYVDPQEFADQTRQQLENAKLADYAESTIKWMPFARIGFLALSILNVTGGVAMIRMRRHGLAMLGSAAALFNVAGCCCVLSFPAGGWALYVLMNPEVRAQFHRPSASGAASSSGG
jgi:hypothetical protein